MQLRTDSNHVTTFSLAVGHSSGHIEAPGFVCGKAACCQLSKKPAAKADLSVYRCERHEEGQRWTWDEIVAKTREACGIQIAVSSHSGSASETLHLRGYCREYSRMIILLLEGCCHVRLPRVGDSHLTRCCAHRPGQVFGTC